MKVGRSYLQFPWEGKKRNPYKDQALGKTVAAMAKEITFVLQRKSTLFKQNGYNQEVDIGAWARLVS